MSAQDKYHEQCLLVTKKRVTLVKPSVIKIRVIPAIPARPSVIKTRVIPATPATRSAIKIRVTPAIPVKLSVIKTPVILARPFVISGPVTSARRKCLGLAERIIRASLLADRDAVFNR